MYRNKYDVIPETKQNSIKGKKTNHPISGNLVSNKRHDVHFLCFSSTSYLPRDRTTKTGKSKRTSMVQPNGSHNQTKARHRTWRANSRVGHTTRKRGDRPRWEVRVLWSSAKRARCWITGNPKAMVFPVPVRDFPMMSRPERMWS